MIKTLIINGSPRKNGDTVSLINELKANLTGEIKIVNTYYDKISPCIDCRYCWIHAMCSIDDGMQEIYSLLNEVDNIIIASPLYFSQLTGSLLNFASRLQYFYVKKYIKKDSSFSLKAKKGVLILVGGGNGGPDRAISMAATLFHEMGAEMVDYVYSLNTDKISTKSDENALTKIKEIALMLN